MNYKDHLARTPRPARRRHRRSHPARARTPPRNRATETAQALATHDRTRPGARRSRAFPRGGGQRAARRGDQRRAAERGGTRGICGRFERDFDAAARELGERRLALNTHALGLRPDGAGLDLSTAHGRAAAFNARIDALTRPVVAGGKGLQFDAAITEMRASAEDAALLRAMEGT